PGRLPSPLEPTPAPAGRSGARPTARGDVRAFRSPLLAGAVPPQRTARRAAGAVARIVGPRERTAAGVLGGDRRLRPGILRSRGRPRARGGDGQAAGQPLPTRSARALVAEDQAG